jgi:hypothetical protein
VGLPTVSGITPPAQTPCMPHAMEGDLGPWVSPSGLCCWAHGLEVCTGVQSGAPAYPALAARSMTWAATPFTAWCPNYGATTARPPAGWHERLHRRFPYTPSLRGVTPGDGGSAGTLSTRHIYAEFPRLFRARLFGFDQKVPALPTAASLRSLYIGGHRSKHRQSGIWLQFQFPGLVRPGSGQRTSSSPASP